jgi:hypothetical protein
MQSKLFGNRLVLDVGVSSHIFDMNESNGIANNKSFSALGSFERFGKSCCLKGQDREELSSQPTMLICATLPLTRFSCQ